MNTKKFSTRVLTVAMALTAPACHSRSASASAEAANPPDDAPRVVVPPPVPPAVPAPPATVPARARAGREDAERAREAAEQQRNKLRAAAARAGGGGGGGGMSIAGGHPGHPTLVTPSRIMPGSDAPAVLSTEAMTAEVQAQWSEDLRIMDKLLRDASGGVEPMSYVMGIAVTKVGRAQPMYVEGAGAVFSYNVGWPLAPSAKAGQGDADQPRERPSAWEIARTELNPPGMVPGMAARSEAPPLLFEQERLDAFLAAVVKVLPEASNFRHLKPDEFVFVSVSGVNEANEPARLTLKARKSDIDAAARGTLDANAFRQRVAHQVR